MSPVEQYLTAAPEPQQTTLRTIRARLRTALPQADEGIKYGLPSFIVDGKGIAAYGAFRSHCSYFPFSGRVLDRVGPLPAGAVASQGTLRFPVDRPLALGVVRSLVKARLAELSEVSDGLRRDYFPDGTRKAEGRMKAGQPHGAWQWWRHDGTLMRTGHFTRGEQTGEWQTWDRSGRLVRTTRC